MRKNTPRIAILLTGVCSLLLLGCNTPKTESWSNPAFKDHDIGKTVVMATFEDPYLSGEFEAVFAQRLRDFVPAVSMHADVKNIDDLDKENVDDLLKQNHVKTLIVTRRVSSVNRDQLVPYGVSYQTYVDETDSTFVYCSSYQPDESVDSFLENSIETTLFEVSSGELIWSGLREVYDFNSKLSNMKSIVREVIRDLEADGMIKATMVY